MNEYPIYLDHHSTTPCDPRVVEKMVPYFGEIFGNPSAVTHAHGRRAATAVEEARSVIAGFFRVRPNEIYFTAGATESNNLVLNGLAELRGRHLITTAVEHKSVLVPATRLRNEGIEVTLLQPDRDGFIDPADLERAIRDDTSLVSIIAASGEIGTIQPLAALAEICHRRGVPFHTDATQAVGKIPLDLSEIPCDLLSFSGHKFYGPKGTGAVFVRRGLRVPPLITGGGQEKGIRSGTLNVPGIIGMAEALRLREKEMADEAVRLTALRNRLWERIVGEIPGTVVHGPRELRLPGNLNVSFEHADAEAIMMALRRFSLSSGAACSSGDRDPSHVLEAIGVEGAMAISSIRFGLGRSNTDEQIDLLLIDLAAAVSRLREISV
ncbi:MAG: cysteine desulfurase family protein [Thermoanaerobaculia bacterium]